MRTLLVWIGAVMVVIIFISPFFWLKFLKARSRWLYIFLSLIIIMIIFILFIRVDNYLGDWFYIKSINYYIVYDSIHTIALIIFKFISSFFPFLILKIINSKITIIKIIVAIILAILIYISYPAIVFFIGIPELIGPALGL